MTTYGTIPTSSSAAAAGTSTNVEYISRAKERIKAGLATRRPWKLMFSFRSFNFPSSFRDSLSRVKVNIGYFRMNYAMIVLLILFLSLLWHPISLIVFVIMMAIWLFLYFLRDEPVLIFGRLIDDRIVLILLSIVTIVLLFLTHATVNILVALVIGVVFVLAHGIVRKTEDLSTIDEVAGLTAPGWSSSS